MNTSYRDAMDALRFTRKQKENMVENLMAAPAGRTVRPLRLRRFAAAGAAAALALSLGVAGAAGVLDSAGSAFAGLFGGGTAETEIIDQIGRPIGASATRDGVTITADAIIGDTYSYAIVYSIRREDGAPLVSREVLEAAAEEGQPLPLSFRGSGASLDLLTSAAHGQSFFYDADPADSAIQFVEMMTCEDPIKPGTATATFRDLSVYTSGDYRSYELLAKGTWRLKFDFAFEDCSVSLPAGQDFTFSGLNATLDAVTLSPLSIQVDYTVHQELAWEGDGEDGQMSAERQAQLYRIFDSLPVVVTYTDGSSLTLGRGGGIAPGGGETVCHKSRIFDTIRPLDEVASVTVGDIVIPVEAGV